MYFTELKNILLFNFCQVESMKFGDVFQSNCGLRVNFGHVRWDADCGPYE